MAEVLAVVCAWCNRVVTPGPSGTHVTHTICPACIDRMVEQPNLPPGRVSAGAMLPPDYFGDAFKS
jgi:hypothetical protein